MPQDSYEIQFENTATIFRIPSPTRDLLLGASILKNGVHWDPANITTKTDHGLCFYPGNSTVAVDLHRALCRHNADIGIKSRGYNNAVRLDSGNRRGYCRSLLRTQRFQATKIENLLVGLHRPTYLLVTYVENKANPPGLHIQRACFSCIESPIVDDIRSRSTKPASRSHKNPPLIPILTITLNIIHSLFVTEH
ncbi:hypothetical protein DdX_03453 [Ditylenchus destructor]|uniref:Uncharacterized protein n=1 Tax=Ditylenchus destructor TaxID=166010 RepID=A0AAD4NFE9_9BILA|nr:hypothetical protein DdX_03453 [Ditylenchus destructor]